MPNAMLNMMKWCRITAIDLSYTNIKADWAGRLAAVLGQCASLAHLDLRWNDIGAEGAGRLAAVAEQKFPEIPGTDFCFVGPSLYFLLLTPV